MGGDKKPEDDIISTAEDAPETISDDALEDIDGGLIRNVSVSSSGLFRANNTTVTADFTGETIYGGDGADILGPNVKTFGKKGFPNPFGGT